MSEKDRLFVPTPKIDHGGLWIRKLPVGWLICAKGSFPGDMDLPIAGFETLNGVLEFMHRELKAFEPPDPD